MNNTNPAMEAVFKRSRDLLSALWEETATAKRHKESFSRNFFFPTSPQNFDAISEEIARLLKQRSITHVVLTAIEQREALKVAVQEARTECRREYEAAIELLSTQPPPPSQNVVVLAHELAQPSRVASLCAQSSHAALCCPCSRRTMA